ncbi:uncharacterized protein SCHCODRAFT_01041471, partial [Schizophyllum commune H4-8]|uniref:uncharacterized protein n=1 Tax=Schizophyllum commune (strain H4-8 / FGSC 9210) TaxID=578458 RepID=UPI00215F15E0
RSSKVHASVVLYFSDPDVADECISRKISWQGTLLRTEKYRPQPIQCYNCFRFGHIASHCRRPATCGKCSEQHRTSEC